MRTYLACLAACGVMATTCGPQTYAPACERWDHIQTAFLGTVIDGNCDGGGDSFIRSLTLVHVDEAFKGLGENEREVFIEPDSFGKCGEDHLIGKQYIFYVPEAKHRREEWRASNEVPARWASKRKLRIFSAHTCSGSREASRLGEDLAWLRKWRTTPTHVYGSVQQNFTGRPWRGVPEGSVPLAFAPVSLMGVNGNYAAKTDIDGRYLFEPVNPGKYVLTVSQPPWRLEKGEEIEISESRPCALRILNMRTNGIVRGSVVDANGKPAAGVPAELVRRLPDGKLARAATKVVKTDAQGRFVMNPVPGAVFALGVNLVSPPTASAPYRNVKLNRALEVAPDGERNGLLIRLPSPIKERLVTVRVFWADGTPVTDRARVWALDGGMEAASGSAANSNTVTLRLLQGRDYRLEADRSLLRAGGGEFASADPVSLPAGIEPAVIELRMRKVW